MTFKILSAATFILLLSACGTTNNDPESIIITDAQQLTGYQNNKATLLDTFEPLRRQFKNYYVIKAVNDRAVRHNAYSNTQAYLAETSLGISYSGNEIELKEGPITLDIAAFRDHPVPIIAIANHIDNTHVSGKVKLTVQANRHYIITGHVSAAYTAVWIEDETGQIVSDIIESIGTDKTVAANTKQAILTAKQQPHIQPIDNIKTGVSYKWLKNKFGPFDKDLTKTKENIFGGTNYRYKRVLRFENIGSFRLDCISNSSCFVAIKEPIIATGNHSSINNIKQTLDQADPNALHYLLKDYEKYDYSNPQAMDIFAQKLSQLKHTNHSNLIKAAIRLCNALGSSGYYRYAEFLQNLINDPKVDQDIIKAAQKAKTELYRGDLSAFIAK